MFADNPWANHFKEAKRSLFSHPKLSLLIIATISIGIALLMTMQTTVYQQSRVPVKHMADELYLVTADNRELEDPPLFDETRMPSLTWGDAMRFYNMETPAQKQSINYTMRFFTERDDIKSRPIFAEGSATDRHFFTMFDVPFLFGAGWGESADVSGEAVVVLSRDMNEQLFGGQNSVGQTINVNSETATIIGVLDVWHINQVFYDRSFSDREKHQVYVPVKFATDRNFIRAGAMSCSQAARDSVGYVRNGDIQLLMNSECGWVNLWAHMPSPESAQQYQTMLQQYVSDERTRGRFPRETDTLVLSLNQYMQLLTDSWSETLLIMAWLFFMVCMINTVGILLAKFLTHSKRVSLYRALGATKSYILKQHLIEVVVLGVLGALFGLMISYFGLQLMFQVEMYQMDYDGDPKVVRQFFSLDVPLVLMAMGIALGSVLVSGLYPIWKICNISPASQLKS